MINIWFRCDRPKRNLKSLATSSRLISALGIKSGDLIIFSHTKGIDEIEEVGTVSLEIEAPSNFWHTFNFIYRQTHTFTNI